MWKRREPHAAQKKHVVVAPLSLRFSKDAMTPSVRSLVRRTGIEMEKALAVCF
jgi:hypothetical protein